MALEYTKKFPRAPSDVLLLDKEVKTLPKNPNILESDIVLFIDIDGVLHPYDCGCLVTSKSDKHGGVEIDKVEGPGLFKWLPKLYDLIEGIPVKLVLHSSWRYYSATYNSIPEELRSKLTDTTDPTIWGRYASIVEYAKRHNVTKAVILDDAGDEFPYGLPELVVCMKTQGLSRQCTFNKARAKLEALVAVGKTDLTGAKVITNK
jgi:hypothetical protein